MKILISLLSLHLSENENFDLFIYQPYSCTSMSTWRLICMMVLNCVVLGSILVYPSTLTTHLEYYKLTNIMEDSKNCQGSGLDGWYCKSGMGCGWLILLVHAVELGKQLSTEKYMQAERTLTNVSGSANALHLKSWYRKPKYM